MHIDSMRKYTTKQVRCVLGASEESLIY